MTLCETYLCAKALFPEASFERGLVRVARLGRYGNIDEQEAALLLDVYRTGLLSPPAQYVLALAPEAVLILETLNDSTRYRQLQRVFTTGNIAAARVLLCDCFSGGAATSRERKEIGEIAARLSKWLPGEATEPLRTGKLTASDIKSLFAPRHAEFNFL